MAGPDVDVVITEIGGTVGDIESLPFLEAARQVRHDVGRDNVFFLHVSLVPYIGPSGELKTKPTQHSVAALRSIGIQPDAHRAARRPRRSPSRIKRKISLMCDVDEEAVVAAVDAPSIYDIPKVLHSEGLDAYVVRRLDLPFRDVDWTEWDELLRRVHHPDARGHRRAGRQVRRPARRLPVGHRGAAGRRLRQRRPGQRSAGSPPTTARPRRVPQRQLGDVDAVCVPGGFGVRGIEGKLGALKYAREHRIPTLGLCLGLQCMVIEYARNVAGLEGANSAEFDEATPHPVIATMADQRDVVAGERDMGGTMRLGLYPAELAEGSIVREVYGDAVRRRAAPAPLRGQQRLPRRARARPGLVFSGTSPDGHLVEYVELPARGAPLLRRHPGAPRAAVAPDPAHPLFRGLIGAAMARRSEKLA